MKLLFMLLALFAFATAPAIAQDDGEAAADSTATDSTDNAETTDADGTDADAVGESSEAAEEEESGGDGEIIAAVCATWGEIKAAHR
ncbi:MAG: hypothetical protein OXQ29_06660 [Rhodospirillaceae bacterium]|nr:hypothetical protein [Rhodospirillaceae bacterium]